MAVKEIELKCWEYIYLIKDIQHFPSGLYGLDNKRSELHDYICKSFGISKEATKKYTDNLDKINYDGTELYLLLLKESRELKGGE